MAKVYEGVAFANVKGHIQIWDIFLQNIIQKIDINMLPMRITSSYIVSIDSNKKQMLLCTMGGDVIEIILQNDQELQTIKANRINKIVLLPGR